MTSQCLFVSIVYLSQPYSAKGRRIFLPNQCQALCFTFLHNWYFERRVIVAINHQQQVPRQIDSDTLNYLTHCRPVNIVLFSKVFAVQIVPHLYSHLRCYSYLLIFLGIVFFCQAISCAFINCCIGCQPYIATQVKEQSYTHSCKNLKPT